MKQLAFLLLLNLGMVGVVLAQGAPDTGGPVPGAVQPTAVPIDGGASLLMAGALAYGVRRLRRHT